MKILFVTNSIDRARASGSGAVMASECLLLAQAGYEVCVVYGEASSCVGAEKRPRSYFISDLQLEVTGNSISNEGLKAIVARERPDIIHFHLYDGYRYANVIEWASSTAPIVFTAHNHLLTCPTMRRFLVRNCGVCKTRAGLMCLFKSYLYHCFYRRPVLFWEYLGAYRRYQRAVCAAARIIVLSKYMKETLVQAGFPVENIEVLPPAIDANCLETVSRARSNNVVLYVGRLYFRKGVHLLLQASKLIHREHRLLIAGDGYYGKRLEQTASELGISQRATFLGWVSGDHIGELYQQAAVLVVPSLEPETFGLAGPEAMSHGCPVVAFDVGGISSWLRDGENGFLVEPKNVGELAKKIDVLLRDERLREEMGERGRQYVLKEYSPERHRQGLVKVYEEVISSFSGRSRINCFT
jgi:glycosyltransferase involved in cell wall biosynthesis